MKRGLVLVLLLVCFARVEARQNQAPEFRFEPSLSYTADLLGNATGGFGTGVRYLDNADLQLNVYHGRTTFLIYGLANQFGNISELSGDIQAVSNIEAERSFRLYEAWANVPLPNLRTSVLAGLYDLNSEFDVINTGGLFMNSSHGIGPDFASSGEMGPSIFPYTSLTVRIKSNPTPWVTVKAAILEAIPSDPENSLGTKIRFQPKEGMLYVTELAFHKAGDLEETLDRGVNEISPFRLVLGGWRYSQLRDGWSGEPEADFGVYVIAESQVYNEDPFTGEGLSAFVRVGFSNARINQFKNYIGTGINYVGLIPQRDEDVFGVALSMPINGDEYLETQEYAYKNEYITEFAYSFSPSDFMSLQIDVQYVANPNQAPNLDNALVVGLRTSISL